MNTRTYPFFAATVVAILASSPAVLPAGDDPLLNRYGQFVVKNGHATTVSRGSKPKTYRVCLEAGRDAVPVRVTHDGEVTIVEPGNCHEFKGVKVRMAAARKPGDGVVMVGRRKLDEAASQPVLAGADPASAPPAER